MKNYNENTYVGPSFSFENKLRRGIWNIVYSLFFRLSPRPFHVWRSFLLKLFGAEVGKGVHVYPKVRIWAPWNLQLGDECGIGDNAILYSQDIIKIGRRAIISQGAHICTGTHDYTKEGHPLITYPISISDYAWVAADAYIGPGVIVDEGAVIAARAVVVKNVEAWTIVGGNPAKFIKTRIMKKNDFNTYFDEK